MSLDLARPCDVCRRGHHGECSGGLCGCIAPHDNDDEVMRGFKALKRALHPERASWTAGGDEQ